MTLELRPASPEDMELVFEWANDQTVRSNSFQTQEITWEEHQDWFRIKLQSPTCKLYIVCQNNQPVGQLRLDIENDSAYISYSVASQHRGQGIGTEILLEAQKAMPSAVNKLVGQVKHDNAASIKAFTKAGFISEEHGENIEFTYTIKN